MSLHSEIERRGAVHGRQEVESISVVGGSQYVPMFESGGDPMRECILMAACAANELLPQSPDLPADVFTSCLTTPIKARAALTLSHAQLQVAGRDGGIDNCCCYGRWRFDGSVPGACCGTRA